MYRQYVTIMLVDTDAHSVRDTVTMKDTVTEIHVDTKVDSHPDVVTDVNRVVHQNDLLKLNFNFVRQKDKTDLLMLKKVSGHMDYIYLAFALIYRTVSAFSA